MLKYRIIVVFIFFLSMSAFGQDKIFEPEVKERLDSLDNRIKGLEKSVRRGRKERNAGYFSTVRELNMTRFVRAYEEYVYDEDFEAAGNLIKSQKEEAGKKHDEYLIEYYEKYASELTDIRKEKRIRYQKLFARERNFKREYKKYLGKKDEHSLKKTLRMVNLAIKYAEETSRGKTLQFLRPYRYNTEALLKDFYSPHDLKKMTKKESKYYKVIDPMFQDDSLEVVQEAVELVNDCYFYSASAKTKLDTNFFSLQKVVAANAIADWNMRQGFTAELSSLTGDAVIARFDTLNREGIYKWNDFIIVIGTVNFTSKSELVRRGEAIIDADRTLFNYMRINRVAKVKSSSAKTQGTFILPYNENGRKQYFRYDYSQDSYQYMVCYKEVINQRVTDDMSQFLLPMQFQEETVQDNK